MMLKMLSGFGAVLICFGLLSCDGDTGAVPVEKSYMALRKGAFQVYTIDSVGYSGVGNRVDLRYELKVVVVDSFENASGSFTYVMHRYTRLSSSEAWRYRDTWSARPEAQRMAVAEGNIEYVKFVIPARPGRRWDGNLYNTRGEDLYELEGEAVPRQVGSLNFDDCLVINQHDEDDGIVFADQRLEVYAKDVGLVSRDVALLNYCTVGCSPLGQIESGYILTQRIIAYGVE